MNLVKCTAITFFSCIVAHAVAQPMVSDHDLQLLYSEIVQIESESLRVMVTLDALQEELDQDLDHDYRVHLFSEMIRFYQYDTQLSQFHKEFTDELQALINPENHPNRLSAPEHSKDTAIIPVHILSRIPEDAIPLPNSKPIRLK